MNITITQVPDINRNIDQAKEELGSRIIENISPLLDEFYVSKLNESRELTEELKSLRKKVIGKKDQLQERILELDRKKKVRKILEKVSKLTSVGLAYDTSFKNEVIVLLKVLDSLPNNKLDFHLKDITQMINKRFS